MRARFLFAIASVLFLASSCTGGKAPPLQGDFPVTKITDRVYVIHGANTLPNRQNQGFMNNPGFVLTRKGVVVIDPGSSVQVGEMVLAKIAGVTREPVIAVFNTHIHGDHWLGNQAIKAAHPKAVIYAHPRMKAKAEAEGGTWVKRIDAMTEGAIRGTRPLAPDIHVDHDESLKLGDTHFRVYHHDKAHTDNDIMIEVVEEKVMFLGDNVFAGRIGIMNDGDFRGNVAAIDMALKSNTVHFIPGHGPANGREILLAYQDYLKTLYATVRKYYGQGLTDYDMKPKVAQALAKYKDWTGFNEQLGRHVSLAYLQVEAESF
ncbi:MAG: hypothetical protein A3E57_06345 [Candidatus Muproteobacteria bacterium RIFCSPHIGHO2_12_FULL_60_33]|uniref:Metallo-beta-lactamase domain-containing protein n=1 Tax=Candidatus Muproteobacteria bacterium RIFCSPLOWO2_01_FULL_60_18 TaxID=1817768 RepID=A0A1F6U6F3_9PROT|nr:MAG: hypothetical protein A2W42_01840 [Candidatus Muproteobacteria bacterium RIFCSPHIGHO2_01_60_12]OGI52928.1 MAG: hypothetical protein A3A87_10515 [Candidatus Muproteobacteria bacterium RIFCSPLOWO2_01_FULL_60_18]OGI54858.1 MAG: hypothetical protein A3E57_06345 [Candidatus Muproteobacteria bacterium RIFCSPHIGHO2_12_FULL_60_33]OGI56767.1 MAG: hypothetical protein A3D32_01680 [Candidatus Muproteobacteria bacterium RIFCSPHIGHO2_02_FULL_60_13]OGI58794.1 MAG: hypothetical protein A2809_06885 [Can